MKVEDDEMYRGSPYYHGKPWNDWSWFKMIMTSDRHKFSVTLTCDSCLPPKIHPYRQEYMHWRNQHLMLRIPMNSMDPSFLSLIGKIDVKTRTMGRLTY